RPQPMMKVLKLGMVGKQSKPLLGDFASAAQGSRVHDPPDLLDEGLGSRILLVELAGGTGLHRPMIPLATALFRSPSPRRYPAPATASPPPRKALPSSCPSPRRSWGRR